MSAQVNESEEALLEESHQDSFIDYDGQISHNVPPPSSRLRKILRWCEVQQKFVWQEKNDALDISEYIGDQLKWREMEEWIEKFDPADHPSNIKKSVLLAVVYGFLAIILLLGLLYIFFVFLQLALFNLVMFVVECVLYWRSIKLTISVIDSILAAGQRRKYKSYVRCMKKRDWLGDN